LRNYLPQLAIITAAILWSFDGFLRQSLYNVPSLIIVAIEHIFGAVLFIPFIFKARKEINNINQRDMGISLLDKYMWRYLRDLFILVVIGKKNF
jgi:hypothetical protein